MSLKFQEEPDDSIVAEINITPLTDIFLVLLIIFMISSSAMLESGFQVKLPSAKANLIQKNENSKPTYITVSKEGVIAVNKQNTTEDGLSEAIRNSLKDNKDSTVIIRGDSSIELGKTVKIMDAAKAAGAEKIALATQQK
jgi:biopolymer transport protein ExbD